MGIGHADHRYIVAHRVVPAIATLPSRSASPVARRPRWGYQWHIALGNRDIGRQYGAGLHVGSSAAGPATRCAKSHCPGGSAGTAWDAPGPDDGAASARDRPPQRPISAGSPALSFLAVEAFSLPVSRLTLVSGRSRHHSRRSFSEQLDSPSRSSRPRCALSKAWRRADLT